ncbi:MAG: hypothetical protein PHU85_08520 [Phycisphaerae bacterium]|nr:hypothetical protein [Phycisphaerae bacterium]
MERKLIWLGLFVGATAGNFVPLLWGGSAMSMSGLLFSLVGGFAGIWLAYKIGSSL